MSGNGDHSMCVSWEYGPVEQQHIRDVNRADDRPDDLSLDVDDGVVTAEGAPETIRWLYDYLHHLKRAWRQEGEQWDADAAEEMAESLYDQVDGDLPERQRTKEVMTDGGQKVADALAALEDGDHVDLVLADRDEPVTAFVRDLDVDLDGLAGVAERTVTLQTFSGETIRAVLQIHNRPDATVELSHAVIGDEPEEQEYIRIQAIGESAQQTLADGGQVEDRHPGWVCDGCGKHVTGTMPVDQCSDCGGRWFEATPERLACDRCGDPDASSVLNSEHNRLCDDCVRWGNVTLEAYEYDKDDVFQGMDGEFWVVTARLWNHDATEYERSSPTGEKFETTMPWHRREYELAKLDPAAMGCDKQRVNEQELTTHFSESSKEKAREYYEEINGEGTE